MFLALRVPSASFLPEGEAGGTATSGSWNVGLDAVGASGDISGAAAATFLLRKKNPVRDGECFNVEELDDAVGCNDSVDLTVARLAEDDFAGSGRGRVADFLVGSIGAIQSPSSSC